MTCRCVVTFALLAALLGPAPRIAVAAELPPDIVRLKNGGMIRGTILEYAPDKDLRILLHGGTEKVIPSNLIEYAGPANARTADAKPPTTPPAPAPPQHPANQVESEDETDQVAPEVDPAPRAAQKRDYETPGAGYNYSGSGGGRVHLTSPERGVTFHLKTGNSNATITGTSYQWLSSSRPTNFSGSASAEHFERLCTAPCSASLQPGTYRLGLSVDDGSVAAADAVHIEGGAELEGVYQSNTAVRVGGLLLLLAGAGVLLTSVENGSDGLLWTSVIGVGIGAGMMFVRDSATVRVK